jgi:hypothetical protein
MTLLVINTLNRLSTAKKRELEAIVGPFTEKCPTVDGDGLFAKAWHVLEELEGDDASENSDAMKMAMDEVIARCRITDEEWEQNDILVLCCCWNTAGTEMRNIAILNAIERRKGEPIKEMVFGTSILWWDLEPRMWNYSQVGLGGPYRDNTNLTTT